MTLDIPYLIYLFSMMSLINIILMSIRIKKINGWWEVILYVVFAPSAITLFLMLMADGDNHVSWVGMVFYMIFILLLMKFIRVLLTPIRSVSAPKKTEQES